MGVTADGTAYDRATVSLAAALRFGIHPSLDAIRGMCEAMGRPQDTFGSVQVTGTNGKTTVVYMVDAILRAHGVRTGRYTSPHLHEYRERICVDGTLLAPAAFARAIEAAFEAASAAGVDTPTEFELLTAGALWAFREAGITTAVLEVGMGGRWDATSVVDPAVAVVTGVGLDHTSHLGTTREAIAAEKARIITASSIPVLGPGTAGVDEVFLARAASLGAEPVAVVAAGDPSPVADGQTVRYRIASSDLGPDDVTLVDIESSRARYTALGIQGPDINATNLAIAIAACEAITGAALVPADIQAALHDLAVPGRFEVLAHDPLVIADGSHNPQAAAVLAGSIGRKASAEGVAVVLGVLGDKDAAGIVAALEPAAASWFVVQLPGERALAADALAEVVADVTGIRPPHFDTVADALDAARASGRTVLATGSLVTAALAREALHAPAPS